MADGRVLVAGGTVLVGDRGDQAVTPLAEVFDPSTKVGVHLLLRVPLAALHPHEPASMARRC
jgi:hypothetical protein